MIVLHDGNLYLIDMDALKRNLFEPLPLTIDPPKMDRITLFRAADFTPKVGAAGVQTTEG